MTPRGLSSALAIAAASACVIGCGGRTAGAPPSDRLPAASPSVSISAGPQAFASATNHAAINPRLLRRFRPVANGAVKAPASNPEQVSLGRMLWYEARLSRGGDISCNTCHDLDQYGVDHRPTSNGDKGQHLRRNAPTVYNASQHLAQFWDGRARDVEEQAKGPMLNSSEMAATRESIESFLRGTPEYRERFQRAFPEQGQPVTLDNVARSIGAFERGLVTTSRWDAYLANHDDALSTDELRGLRVFLEVGCTGCHTGPQVGASMFQVTGIVEPWPAQADLGRFEVTGAATDRMVFKVPTLKNVTKTAPYFHDGSCDTLEAAVRLMGRHQLGIELSEREVNSIVAFLGALAGDLPRAYIARPQLPGAPRPSGRPTAPL